MAKGAKHVAGASPGEAKGNYVEPVLVTGVTPDMQVCADETFGPLAAVIRFDSEEQAIELANDTPYGLAAYFYSTNIHRVWRVADALEAGIIGVNEGAVSNAAAPFGGVKWSGHGQEDGAEGVMHCMVPKTIHES